MNPKLSRPFTEAERTANFPLAARVLTVALVHELSHAMPRPVLQMLQPEMLIQKALVAAGIIMAEAGANDDEHTLDLVRLAREGSAHLDNGTMPDMAAAIQSMGHAVNEALIFEVSTILTEEREEARRPAPSEIVDAFIRDDIEAIFGRDNVLDFDLDDDDDDPAQY